MFSVVVLICAVLSVMHKDFKCTQKACKRTIIHTIYNVAGNVDKVLIGSLLLA